MPAAKLELEKTGQYFDGLRSQVHRTDNGIIFYVSGNSQYDGLNLRFCAQNVDGRGLNISMPSNCAVQLSPFHAMAHGNSFFFVATQTVTSKVVTIKSVICKAELDSSGFNISASVFRELLINQGDTPFGEGMYSRVLDDKTYVYRMCDDPEKDAIIVKSLVDLKRVHQGRAVYVKSIESGNAKPSVIKSEDGAFEIEIPSYQSNYLSHSMFCLDPSPFLYFMGGTYLYALDTRIMKFRSALNTQDGGSIIGVDSEDIFVCVYDHMNRQQCCKAATLPNGYFESDLEIQSRSEMDKLAERVKKLEAARSGSFNEMREATHRSDSVDVESKVETKTNSELQEMTLTQSNVIIVKEINEVSAESPVRESEESLKNQEWAAEKERMQTEIAAMKKLLIQSKVWALESVKSTLKFPNPQILSKPLVCIQVEDGTIIYFDNAKPFELFFINDEIRVNADLKLLDGEYDCSFRGSIGNHAFFSTSRGKIIKFFKAKVTHGEMHFEQIIAMKTSDISLFKNEPLYFIERSKEWSVYKYDENYKETEGEKFDISEIDLLSKYERHYHRSVLYLFRDTPTARVEKINEKVVCVEGPLLDETSFYTPPHSNFIYILNSEQNVLLTLNTIDLTVSQHCYEPPAGSNNNSIVGIHNGMITMAFDGIWGRQLSTSKIP